MKKLGTVLLLFLMTICFIPNNVKAENTVNIYFFHGYSCPHCLEEEEWLEEIKNSYSNVEVYQYEVWLSDENNALMEKIKEIYEITSAGVPFTVIGDQPFIGFSETIGSNMEAKIREYSVHEYEDKAGIALGITTDAVQGEELETYEETQNREEEIAAGKVLRENNQKIWIPLAIVLGSAIVIAGGTGLFCWYKKKNKTRI